LYFLKSFDSFRNDHSAKWLKFLDKIFKIFIRKRCNYRIYIVDESIVQVRSCFGQHHNRFVFGKSINYFSLMAFGSFTPTKSFLVELLNRCKFWNVFNGNRLSHICGSSSFTSTESSETVSYKVLQKEH
jgi:hypothetical protein